MPSPKKRTGTRRPSPHSHGFAGTAAPGPDTDPPPLTPPSPPFCLPPAAAALARLAAGPGLRRLRLGLEGSGPLAAASPGLAALGRALAGALALTALRLDVARCGLAGGAGLDGLLALAALPALRPWPLPGMARIRRPLWFCAKCCSCCCGCLTALLLLLLSITAPS